MPGAVPAAQPLARRPRALCRLQVVQADLLGAPRSRRSTLAHRRPRRGARRPGACPGTAALSVCVELAPMRPSFSERSVSRWLGEAPLAERTCLTATSAIGAPRPSWAPQRAVSPSAGSSAGVTGVSGGLGSDGSVRRRSLRRAAPASAASPSAPPAADVGRRGDRPGRRRRADRPCAAPFVRSGDAEHLADRDAAQLGDVLGLAQAVEALHRRLHQVDRVLGADALGEHVADAAQLEHGADAAAGDHAGTGAGRAQHDVAGAEAADHPVGDRLAVLGHADQVLAGVLDRLLDRQRAPRGPCRSRSRPRSPRRRRRRAR